MAHAILGPLARWHPALAACLLAVAAGYLSAARTRPRGVASLGRASAFVLACLAAYAALGSPVATLAAHTLFSAYVLQTVLLGFVAAPLVLAALPTGSPRRLLRHPRMRAAAAALTSPVVATIGFHVFLGLYLLPLTVGLTLANPLLHALGDALVLGGAMCMWWPLLSPSAVLPRLAEPAQLLYLLANWLIILVAFGLLVFGRDLPYPVYQEAVRPLHLTARLDRQLSGLIIGVIPHLAYGVIVVTAFYRWAAGEAAVATPQRLYGRLREGGFSDAEARAVAGLPPLPPT